MTVIPGGRWSGLVSTARFSSSWMARAWARPSINRAGMGSSLLRQLGHLDGARYFHREASQIRHRRVLADADGHLHHVWMLEDGRCDPLGHCLKQVGRFALEDLASDLLQERVAHRVTEVIAGCRPLGIEHDLEVGGEGLAKLALRGVVAVIAVGLEAGEDEPSGRHAGAWFGIGSVAAR